MKQKTTLFKTIVLAAAMMLGGEAWAAEADILSNRSATNELFRLERQGEDSKYFISSGIFTKTTLGSTTDMSNVWYVNGAERYIKIDLPTGITFQIGDVINIYGAHSMSYNVTRGFCISSVVPVYDSTNKEYTHSKILLNMSSSYTANTLENITYTVSSEDIFVGQSSLYIAPDAKNKIGIQKITITRTGADDLVPEAVSDKTWDFSSLFTSTSDNTSFTASVVNDNLYYAKSTNIKAVSSTKYPRFTSSVSNTLDFTSMENGVAFMVRAGKGVITVYQISDNAPRLYTKSGESATQLTLIAGTKDDETGLTPHYYEYNTDYDTPFAVVRGGGNTYIAKIVVSPNRPIATVDNLGYTFSSTLPLDFTETSVRAYIATYDSKKDVMRLTQVNKIPANTGVLIFSDSELTNQPIPVTSESTDDVTGNKLVAVSSAMTLSAASDGYENYVLAIEDDKAVFQLVKTNSASMSAGQAYLQIPKRPAGARSLRIVFDDETTGVADVRGKMEDVRGDFFNLQGQRVDTPKKGLYIVNGKKVIVK